jgi:hypothetical protein
MLYYHKCNDCLTPFSSIEKKVDICDCGGSIAYMGIVQGDKWEKTEQRAPCDGRCTHAHGPHCDCSCGGVNHGTGRVVATIVAEGKVKVVSPSADIYDEMVRGYKFRELRDNAEALFTKTFAGFDKWSREVRLARRDLNHALGLKVYDRREKAIIAFVLSLVKPEDNNGI